MTLPSNRRQHMKPNNFCYLTKSFANLLPNCRRRRKESLIDRLQGIQLPRDRQNRGETPYVVSYNNWKTLSVAVLLSILWFSSAFADDLTPRPTMGEILRLDPAA